MMSLAFLSSDRGQNISPYYNNNGLVQTTPNNQSYGGNIGYVNIPQQQYQQYQQPQYQPRQYNQQPQRYNNNFRASNPRQVAPSQNVNVTPQQFMQQQPQPQNQGYNSLPNREEKNSPVMTLDAVNEIPIAPVAFDDDGGFDDIFKL